MGKEKCQNVKSNESNNLKKFDYPITRPMNNNAHSYNYLGEGMKTF